MNQRKVTMNLIPQRVGRKLFRLKERLIRPSNRKIVDRFHCLYYDSPHTWKKNTYFGHRIKQLPLDMWLYQEVIFSERPSFILQTGVAFGGSLLFFAHILDLINADPGVLVVGVDIKITDEAKSISHPRIRLIEGSSIDPKTVGQVEKILPSSTGMVSLDSDHSYAHVLSELNTYCRFVGVGGHLVVEDTNVNEHPVYPSFGPGPLEAVNDFLKSNGDFTQDNDLWRRNLFSFHQYGWLLRMR